MKKTFLISISCMLSACAGTKVLNVIGRQDATSLPPRTIAVVVENQSPPPRKESDRPNQLAAAKLASETLSSSLTQTLLSHHLNIAPSSADADLVLDCSITEVRSGNRALRTLVGYGAGRAVLKMRVTLTAASTPSAPLLTFETNGTTGGLPGLGFGLTSGNAMSAGGAALGLHGALKQGLERELSQANSEIDGQLAKFFASRNWLYLPASQVTASINPKRSLLGN